jgi:hypothetical protein
MRNKDLRKVKMKKIIVKETQVRMKILNRMHLLKDQAKLKKRVF